MDPQSVKAFPAEGGDQSRVNVEYAVRPAGGEPGAQNAHEPGQDDEIDVRFPEHFFQPGLKLRSGQDQVSDTCPLGPLEGIGFRVVCNDQTDLSALQNAGFLRIQQRLQVCAAPGYQDGDLCFPHSLRLIPARCGTRPP